MRGGVQRSTESSREAPTSQRRGWLPRGPVFTIVLLVVAITVAAAAGAALASLFSGGAPTELQAEARFLQLMVPHHEAAVPMAQAVLEETDRKEVERLAGSIVASQQAEIELMRGLLQRRGVTVEDGEGEPDPGRPSHDADGHSPGGH